VRTRLLFITRFQKPFWVDSVGPSLLSVYFQVVRAAYRRETPSSAKRHATLISSERKPKPGDAPEISAPNGISKSDKEAKELAAYSSDNTSTPLTQ
jgi:hypothetical protein